MQAQPLEIHLDQFQMLEPQQRLLIKMSLFLYERELHSATALEDYSFIVFPMAKAYEGYVKSFLLSAELIDQPTYESRKFRIGRALNPDVAMPQRDEHWLYDDVTHVCGKALAQNIWQTWLQCRNHVFHYFPEKVSVLTLSEAGEYLSTIGATILEAQQCQLSFAAQR